MTEEILSPETETETFNAHTALMQHLEPEKPETESDEPVEAEAEVETEVQAESEEVEDEIDIELIHNGKPVVKKLSDVKNLAQMGFDYSAKMQKVNADKETVSSTLQALEAEKTQIAAMQQRYVESLELVERLNQDGGISDADLNKLLEEGDNDTYLKLKAQKEMRLKSLEVIKAEQASAKKAIEDRQTSLLLDLQKKGREKLQEVMPHLLEPKGAQELQTYLTSSFGYSSEQINTVADPNLFVLAEKARLYDAMMSKAKQNPVHKTQPVLKSKASPVPAPDAQKAKLNSTLKQLGKQYHPDLAVEALRHLI